MPEALVQVRSGSLLSKAISHGRGENFPFPDFLAYLWGEEAMTLLSVIC